MNKYQKALIELVVAVSYTPEENNICGTTPDVIEKYKNTLQELADKEIPKQKVKIF